MNTRTLIFSDASVKRYAVFNQDGVRVGTDEEWTVLPEQLNEAALRDKARQALTTNDTYLALTTPTAAQNTAQVQRLTRECNILLRDMLGALDTTEGT